MLEHLEVCGIFLACSAAIVIIDKRRKHRLQKHDNMLCAMDQVLYIPIMMLTKGTTHEALVIEDSKRGGCKREKLELAYRKLRNGNQPRRVLGSTGGFP